ncbi:uncharacterized protein MYCFIDRAFT_212279 [Pseudocercospora fijiensis CIRAD86]|uniref:Uncharacterized protein n=1 Tax=Pseudocercospora fijiensis (strain CIRAD86) TaxID=383855 RepID=M2YPI9_PSEFD|nr:uncharacterized protein MYCFIDRAFT_212279 [Pseudocercospora fijiensis CIRAD86]EME79660.1 hypothetical protein MYCFIDRAFT_212279 [Pseudocercospora fijiensis CIRAD86]
MVYVDQALRKSRKEVYHNCVLRTIRARCRGMGAFRTLRMEVLEPTAARVVNCWIGVEMGYRAERLGEKKQACWCTPPIADLTLLEMTPCITWSC